MRRGAELERRPLALARGNHAIARAVEQIHRHTEARELAARRELGELGCARGQHALELRSELAQPTLLQALKQGFAVRGRDAAGSLVRERTFLTQPMSKR